MDTTPVNLTLPGAPSSAFYNTCGTLKQGMSVGWGDTYGSTLAGQSFDINGLPEADYDLTIIADPNDRLLETNETDNLSCVRLHINPSARTVQNLGVCGSSGGGGGGTAVTIARLDDGAIKPGQTETMTILGTGFTPQGVFVALENGSGPAPTISVNSIDATGTEIKVTVAAAKGGGKGTRYWDLRVGSATLPRALVIQP